MIEWLVLILCCLHKTQSVFKEDFDDNMRTRKNKCKRLEAKLLKVCLNVNIFQTLEENEGVHRVYTSIEEEFNKTTAQMLQNVTELYRQETIIQEFLDTSYQEILETTYQEYIASDEGRAYIESEYKKRMDEAKQEIQKDEINAITYIFNRYEQYADSFMQNMNYALMMWRSYNASSILENPNIGRDLITWLQNIQEGFKERFTDTESVSDSLTGTVSYSNPTTYWWNFQGNRNSESHQPVNTITYSVGMADTYNNVWMINEPWSESDEELYKGLDLNNRVQNEMSDELQKKERERKSNQKGSETDTADPGSKKENVVETKGEQTGQRLIDETLDDIYTRIIDSFVYEYDK